MYWMEFLLSAVLIVIAGARLTVYADKISDKFHIGKTWVGILLLGFVTSLPEAITSITAVVSIDADDLALGNLLGSNNFNILLIVVMDFLYRKGSVTNAINVRKSHSVSAYYSIVLIALVFVQVALGGRLPVCSNFSMSFGGLLVAIIYLVGMRHLCLLGKTEGVEAEVISPYLESSSSNVSTQKMILNVLVCACFVIVGAIWLANSAEMISVQTGLGRTFVGSKFLALATSLPEMVVTISALKMGSFDLAIGNIFGSNMSNMFIVALCDYLRRGTSMLNMAAESHALTGVLGLVLSVFALVGLSRKNKRTIFSLGWDSWGLIVVFVVGNLLIYKKIIFEL